MLQDIIKDIHKMIALVILGACILGVGCGHELIWREEVRSPDGLWLASAETIQNGGFGSAAIQTMVYLKSTTVSRPPTEVLEFWCKGPAPRPYVLDNVANKGGTINLTMNWLSPSHLEVTYNGRASIDRQIVRYSGVEISLTNRCSDITIVPRNTSSSVMATVFIVLWASLLANASHAANSQVKEPTPYTTKRQGRGPA